MENRVYCLTKITESTYEQTYGEVLGVYTSFEIGLITAEKIIKEQCSKFRYAIEDDGYVFEEHQSKGVFNCEICDGTGNRVLIELQDVEFIS